MDMDRVGNIFKINQIGQSTVEYVLLFAVVASIASFVFKSDAFGKLFGEQGKFANVYKRELEYSYRHGLSGRKVFSQPNYSSGSHDSYSGRFFGSKDAYPQ